MRRCSSILLVAALASLGCTASPPPPAAPPPGAVTAPSAEPVPAAQLTIWVQADDTILVDGRPVAGPSEAVAQLRPTLAPGQQLEITDQSNGGTALMALVAELRQAGVEKIVVRFEEPGAVPPPNGEPTVATEPVPPPPPGAGSLPEVRVKNVGLHIGGGPNDEATKAPFQAAVERHFGDLRGCYRLVSKPEQGGVFGVDLRIPGQGGKPTIQAQRTAMGGEDFRQCVSDVFARVEFERPSRGPTVISYSIRFDLED